MTPEDLMRIAENQRKIAEGIKAKIEVIQEIIKRLALLEQWEEKGVHETYNFFHNFDIFRPDGSASMSFRYSVDHRRVAPKIIPILKEEMLLNLAAHNAELEKLKERLTGVKEEKS